MTEINVNKINDKYFKYTELLENKDKPEGIKFDTYTSINMQVTSVDFGNIRLSDGTLRQMFAATSIPDEYAVASLYLSYDGINWIKISYPNNETANVYHKVVIHNGDVYTIFDDECKRFSNFIIDGENSSMDEYDLMTDICDIAVIKNTLYLLADNGIHKVNHNNETEFIGITGDFPFGRFIKSTSDEMVIMGMAGNFPIFLIYDGESHVVFCTIECNPITAICLDDKILCYTDDSKVVAVNKTYNMLDSKYILYNGRKWTGEVYYKHGCFWLAYTDFNGSDGNYTIIAKSINGIDFDADVRIPYCSDNDGVSIWAQHTYCVCAGNMYTLIASENYFNYIEEQSCYTATIAIDNTEISFEPLNTLDIDKSVFIGKIIDVDNNVLGEIKYDKAPYLCDNGDIGLVLKDGDYTDKSAYITTYCIQ